MLLVEVVHVPIVLSLIVVAAVLAVSVVASLLHRRRHAGDPGGPTP
jgi:hypothetical protein